MKMKGFGAKGRSEGMAQARKHAGLSVGLTGLLKNLVNPLLSSSREQ